MPRFTPVRKSPKKRRASSTMLIVALVGAFALLSVGVFAMSGNSSSSVHASPVQKKYKGTKAIVAANGQRRLPTQEEVDQTVSNLAALASRPENVSQVSGPVSGVTVDPQGGYGGVMLARPNEDGTWESKCVFTFEEGVEFLGLVEDTSAE